MARLSKPRHESRRVPKQSKNHPNWCQRGQSKPFMTRLWLHRIFGLKVYMQLLVKALIKVRTNSHGFQILGPSILEVNPCNLSRWEHQNLPLHMRDQTWHGCLHGNTFWRWDLGWICTLGSIHVHSKLRSITPVATKVHMILRSFVVLT